MNDIQSPAGITYFQYTSNNDFFGPQVFFWLSNQGVGTETGTWIQFIANYDQAEGIANWLSTAQSGGTPAPLTLNLNGGTLSFSSTGQTITINGQGDDGPSLTGTFNIQAFAPMIWAAIFSILAMVGNGSAFAQGASDPAEARKILGQ